MGSTGKSPPYNGANCPFSSAPSYSENGTIYKEKSKLGLYSKAGSLGNLASMEKTSQAFSRTLSDFDRANGHFSSECKDLTDAYSRSRLPAGELRERFSPETSRINGVEKASIALKKAEVLKEQTNYASSNDVWLQQKKIRPPQEQLRNKKSLLSEQGESFDNGQYLQQNNLNLHQHIKHGIANDSMGITHNYQGPEDHQLSYVSHTTTCVSPDTAAMHAAKSYGVLTPQRYAADIAHSSMNICGGDSEAIMIHSQPSAKWNSRVNDKDNRKFFSEKKYAVHRGSNNEPKSMNETSIAAMNVSSMSSSPAATDLSQHSASSSSNQLHRDNSLQKPFSHIILSSQEQGVSDNREAYTIPGSTGEKDEKRYNLGNFKHSAWGNFEAPLPLFSEQQHPQGRPHHHQHPYEATFCTDCNPTGMPHPAAGPYDMNPLLLKENDMLVKQERGTLHPPALPMAWGDKDPSSFDKMIGSMYKPTGDRVQYYLKPPPVDLDELSEDERERMRVKRERNRVAAAKCRNRRRELLERLEKEAEQLEREQEVLRDNVKRLQAQKRKLGNMLDKHEPGCTNKIDENAAQTFSADVEASEKNATD